MPRIVPSPLFQLGDTPESAWTRLGRRRIAFGWYGGKYSHLGWLLPLLPQAHRYCEPFGGSAAVLLNREPSSVETYNDIDGEVVNFFRVLRDDKERLIQSIGLTPFSREEFYLAVTNGGSGLSDMERARHPLGRLLFPASPHPRIASSDEETRNVLF